MIAATSSYISLPPPYTHFYSAGGPTGEVHLVDPLTGGFGEKVQQVLFVPENELEEADKTRVALVRVYFDRTIMPNDLLWPIFLRTEIWLTCR